MDKRPDKVELHRRGNESVQSPDYNCPANLKGQTPVLEEKQPRLMEAPDIKETDKSGVELNIGESESQNGDGEQNRSTDDDQSEFEEVIEEIEEDANKEKSDSNSVKDNEDIPEVVGNVSKSQDGESEHRSQAPSHNTKHRDENISATAVPQETAVTPVKQSPVRNFTGLGDNDSPQLNPNIRINLYKIFQALSPRAKTAERTCDTEQSDLDTHKPTPHAHQ